MEKFTVTIDGLDNAAFGDERHEEVAQLLVQAAVMVDRGYREGSLLDADGRRAGWFGFVSADAP